MKTGFVEFCFAHLLLLLTPCVASCLLFSDSNYPPDCDNDEDYSLIDVYAPNIHGSVSDQIARIYANLICAVSRQPNLKEQLVMNALRGHAALLAGDSDSNEKYASLVYAFERATGTSIY